MFENFSNEELEKLNRVWNAGKSVDPEMSKNLKDRYWYPAKIISVDAQIRNDKPCVQVLFSVEGHRLVQDFWLTEKGIYVFKRFFKKVFGIEVESPRQLNEFELLDRECDVLISRREFQNSVWFEIVDFRRRV